MKTLPKQSRPTKAPRRQQGTVALFALMLTLIFAAGAFALDIGHALVVRNELQNAADAGALAGARALYNPGTESPNWGTAQTQGVVMVSLNGSDGVPLSQSLVEPGYLNVTGTPAGLQPPTITPGADDVPAVRVTVSRDSQTNGGALKLSFGGFVGLREAPISATAVAFVSGPGSIAKGGLFPLAISKCLYDTYWDSAKMAPKNDPATGKPYTFKIGSDYHYAVCSSGEWTSFDVDKNDTTFIRDLMNNGNPTPLAIGDNTWIQPGTKNTIFDEVPKNIDVVIPVVVNVDNHSFQPIVAFAAFHIDMGVGGSGKYVQGHFTTNVPVTSNAAGNGPYYGAFIPPRLAQ